MQPYTLSSHQRNGSGSLNTSKASPLIGFSHILTQKSSHSHSGRPQEQTITTRFCVVTMENAQLIRHLISFSACSCDLLFTLWNVSSWWFTHSCFKRGLEKDKKQRNNCNLLGFSSSTGMSFLEPKSKFRNESVCCLQTCGHSHLDAHL